MHAFIETAVSNTIVAAVLALLIAVIARFVRHAPCVHALWLLVLIKLVTPPLGHWPVTFPSPVTFPWSVMPDPTTVTLDGPVSLPSGQTMNDTHSVAGSESPTTQSPQLSRPEAARIETEFRSLSAGEIEDRAAATDDSDSWLLLVCAVWLTGSFAVMSLTLIRVRAFHRLVRTMRPGSSEVISEVRSLSKALDMARPPVVCETTSCISPLVWSPLPWIPAAIIVPTGLIRSLSAEERSTLLLHELAHLRRRDHWVRWFESVVVVVYWWNPVAWWVRRELHRAADHCCDAWVIDAQPENSRSYARALMSTMDFLAESGTPLPPLASGIGQVNFLERRMKMILKKSLRKDISWTVRLVILGVALAVLPAATRTGTGQDRSPRVNPEPEGGRESETSEQPELSISITANDVRVDGMTLQQALSRLRSLLSGQAARPEGDRSFEARMSMKGREYVFSQPAEALKVLEQLYNVLLGATMYGLDHDALGLPEGIIGPVPQAGRGGASGNGSVAGGGTAGAAGASGSAGGGGGTGGSQGSVRGGAGGATQTVSPAVRQRMTSQMQTFVERSLGRYEVATGAIRRQTEPGQATGTQLDGQLRTHTLLSRRVHGDYEKSTLSIEFALRDDPGNETTNNDWQIQFGNGPNGDEFTMEMVQDDQGAVVNLGRVQWRDLDLTQLPELTPSERRTQLTAMPGHIYLLRATDTNSDVYALIRVESLQRGECELAWKQLDVQDVTRDGKLVLGSAEPSRVEE